MTITIIIITMWLIIIVIIIIVIVIVIIIIITSHNNKYNNIHIVKERFIGVMIMGCVRLLEEPYLKLLIK